MVASAGWVLRVTDPRSPEAMAGKPRALPECVRFRQIIWIPALTSLAAVLFCGRFIEPVNFAERRANWPVAETEPVY